MKIKLNQKIKGYDGKEIEGATLKELLVNSISFESQERKLNSDEKMRAFRFGLAVEEKDEMTITTEMKEQILKGAEKAYPALVYGRIYTILNEEKDANA